PVVGAQFGEHVLVRDGQVHHRVVAAVVEVQRAVGAAHHAAGEHDVRHVHVVGLGDPAVGPGREEHRDARHLYPPRVVVVVQGHAEDVRVTVHCGPYAVEQVEPAVLRAYRWRAGAYLVGERARPPAGLDHRLVADVPPARPEVVGVPEPDLPEDAPGVAGQRVVGPEQP